MFKFRDYSSKWKGLLDMEKNFSLKQFWGQFKNLSPHLAESRGVSLLHLRIQQQNNFFRNQVLRLHKDNFAQLPYNKFTEGSIIKLLPSVAPSKKIKNIAISGTVLNQKNNYWTNK